MATFNNYLDEIFKTSEKYLKSILNEKELNGLIKSLNKKKNLDTEDCVHNFDIEYRKVIKEKHQQTYSDADKDFNKFLIDKKSQIKVVWGDCLTALKKMHSESVHCMVTSPPYYNTRDYSIWKNIDDYMDDMRLIIRETYRVLDNHRVWVFNVGDIFDNPKTKTNSVWGKTRLPLGAYFIKLFEEEGFTFVDDIIWDKGEVQSERNKHGANPYPFYQYPINCYEHILIFHKHRLDLTRFPCPRCGSLFVNGNTQSEVGLQSWECKNEKCFERSASNRGKRFSLKTNMTQSEKFRNDINFIEDEMLKMWRRDIVKLNPVIKINSKGKNILGHTAPFPIDIPKLATKFFSYENDLVLDPFAGSFTSPKIAADLKRIGVGIELNKGMFETAIMNRLKGNDEDLFFKKHKIDFYDLTNEEVLHKQIIK